MTDGTQSAGDAGAGDNPWAPPESRPSLAKNPRQPAPRPSAPQYQAPPPPQQPPAWDQPSAPAQPPAQDQPPAFPPPSVHDQATMASISTAGFPPPAFGAPAGESAVPPPPIAPTGPAAPGGYGYPAYPQGYGWPGMPMARQNGMGTAAMVLGILSCCLFCLYGVVSVVLGILAIVFGVKGRRKAERGEADNHGQAQAGLITGVIGLILGVVVLILIAVGITFAINDERNRQTDEDPYYGATGTSVSVLAER
ncbi:DUF4190 domain-containing protein [Streptomyces sp. NPDC046831]|uniref:DUF4190 domain-containing protein n=1 Tax=Streptomyces sp. NPDC046831 TaxID=3154805 RepID=UPI0033D8E1A7